MLLQRESNPALNTVTAYGPDYIQINEVDYRHAVHFGPEGAVTQWQVQRVAEITTDALRTAAGLEPDPGASPLDFLDDGPRERPANAPEVMLVGTGLRQHLLPMAVQKPLLKMGIGIEAMTTEAAARTYNILMAEGRRVVAALLPNKEIE